MELNLASLLVVGHVLWSGAKLRIGFDNLVDGIQEIFLSGDLEFVYS
jgi:hypothetical protein